MKIYKNIQRLNDSNFLKEGEYILEEKPKYKYEIKIKHINSKCKNNLKSKTPEKIISAGKFNIINNKGKRKNKITPCANNTQIIIIPNICQNCNNHHNHESNISQNELYEAINRYLSQIRNELDANNNNYLKNKPQSNIFNFKSPLRIEKQSQYFLKSETNLNNSSIDYNNNQNIDISYQKNYPHRINNKKYLYYTPDNKTNYTNKIYRKKKLISNDYLNKTITNNINSKKKSTKEKTINKTINNLSQEIIILKSSEMKEIIKPIQKGKKIKPLTIKKIVNKPYIEKIEQENGSIITIMKQKSVMTSIENEPLHLKPNDKFKDINENYIKERITNIYTTFAKNVKNNDDDNNNIRLNKSVDCKNKKKSNKNFIYNKIIRKKNYYFNKNDRKNNNSLIFYCSRNSNMFEQIEPKKVIKINEEIKKLKNFYINNEHDSLYIFFLELSDEEKIGILTNLKNAGEENDSIYKILINILKEKGTKEG